MSQWLPCVFSKLVKPVHGDTILLLITDIYSMSIPFLLSSLSLLPLPIASGNLDDEYAPRFFCGLLYSLSLMLSTLFWYGLIGFRDRLANYADTHLKCSFVNDGAYFTVSCFIG